MQDDYLSDDSGDDDFASYSPRPNQGSSTNWGLIIGLLAGAGLLAVLLCCGGIWYLFDFGTGVLTEEVRAELEDNPAIQEHIGTIQSMSMDMTKSAAAEADDVLVFRIEGNKGSGYVTVESITNDAGMEEVVDGSLKLDSGETIPLTSEDVPISDDEPERTDE